MLYSFCFAALLASNGLSLWRVRNLQTTSQRRPAGINIEAVDKFRALPLSHRPHPMNLTESNHPYLLVFLFRPFDCSTTIEELEKLEQLRVTRPDVAIYGLMFGASWDEARKTEINFGLHFPILADETGALREVFRPPQTPWKVLLNGQTLSILKEDGPSLTASEKDSFFLRMTQLAHVR